jgi:hypothetical protein
MKSENEQMAAEEQVAKHERIVDYDTKEYPVETIVEKYVTDLEKDENELFVPDYQREHTWDEKRQSKFIESVLIGLPIPFIFVADTAEANGRLEIVDGSQRIRTLAAFIGGALVLEELEKLTALNGFRFQDLPVSRQRRFKRRTMRMIELTQKADEEVRRDIFERINTGSDILKDMEVRFGIAHGPLLDMIRECAQLQIFKDLAPLPEVLEKRREREEFVTRFFAYLDNYKGFERRVREFLDDYLKREKARFDDARGAEMKAEFERMLAFIEKYSPNGFRKGPGHTRTPRIRFEAMAVGTALALREKPDLVPRSMRWVDSPEFFLLTTSDSSNSRPKVVNRIEFVRDSLLS